MTLSAASSSVPKQQHTTILRLIGVFKILKGVGLIIAAISILHLIHRDAVEYVTAWCHRLHIAPGNRYVAKIIGRVAIANARQFVILGCVLLAYAAMFLVEGIGLLLAEHWAEWMAVITTSLLIPFEIYEMIRKPTWLKGAAMIINIVMAIYLFIRARRENRELKQHITPS